MTAFKALLIVMRLVVRLPISSLKWIRDFQRFRRLGRSTENQRYATWRNVIPCLNDRNETTPFDRHYVYHPAWAIRRILDAKPNVHVDIASSLSFVTMLSAIMEVHFYDYRPTTLHLSGLKEGYANLTSLPFDDRSITSLSCLHVVEHVGLGRYGDPLDPEADQKAARELQRILANDGSLYFVVPVGQPRICFNAHRIYSYEDVVSMFNELRLKSFSLICDDGSEQGVIWDAAPSLVQQQRYACGCFVFTRTDKP